jgi:hypothetical protein
MNENEEQQARERIEDARSEAAALIVQRSPIDNVDSGADEQKILDVADAARQTDDPRELEDLADRAEAARDEIREEAYGRQDPDK